MGIQNFKNSMHDYGGFYTYLCFLPFVNILIWGCINLVYKYPHMFTSLFMYVHAYMHVFMDINTATYA